MIEADANANGSVNGTRDRRRRTEQGRSALSYTRVAAQTAFDRARVEAPPSAPDARRPLIERYFDRPADAGAQRATPAPAPTDGSH